MQLTDVQYKKSRLILFALSFTVLLIRALYVSVYDEGRARNQIYGDGYSDINTISSAKYFYDSGFVQTAFLPVHDYYPQLLQTKAYTHYPAVPNILAGMYARLFGSYKEPVLRIIPLLLAVFFFFFIFHVLHELTGNNLHAFIGGAAITFANYYICWADNLHQHLYGELLKWGYFLLLLRYYRNPKSTIWHFWPMLLIMMVEVNISFEQPVFLGVLTLGFSVAFRKKIFSVETIAAALFVCIGFGLHLYQNALYFGSWQLALDDMKHAFFFRTAGVEGAGQKAESAFGPADYWQVPFNWFNRMERFYVFPGWAVLLLAIWVMSDLRKRNPEIYRVVWCLFFASVAWTFCMAQHAFIHTFTNKHFAIWYAVIVGLGVPIFWEKLRVARAAGKTVQVVLMGIMGAYMIGMFITQQLIPVFIHFGVAYPFVKP